MSEQSQALALSAFSYLASKEEELVKFLSATGLTPQSLKQDIQKPETHAAIIDYLLQNDTLLIEFCDAFEFPADLVWKLREDLPGAPGRNYQSI